MPRGQVTRTPGIVIPSVTTDPRSGRQCPCLLGDQIQQVLEGWLICVDTLQPKGEPFEMQMGVGEPGKHTSATGVGSSLVGDTLLEFVARRFQDSSITNRHRGRPGIGR